jgi:23S rRNA (uracil1939-C5)-methyltransferase
MSKPHDSVPYKQGDLVELEITDLNDGGEGVGRAGSLVVFVPDTVTGDCLVARLVRIDRGYAQGTISQLLSPSPHRVKPSCIVADKCGGCQLQHIDYDYQLAAKQERVVQTLTRIGGFSSIPIAPMIAGDSNFEYRNKVTYPLGLSRIGTVKAGYYRKGTHKIVNINQCPVQDRRLNPLLAGVKLDIQAHDWRVYGAETNDRSHSRKEGEVRHLGLRIGRHTGEILLTLVATNANLPGIESQARDWLKLYPDLVGVCLNINDRDTNKILGAETLCLAGRDYLHEEFGGLVFQLGVDTFFQVYTEQAETLLQTILDRLQFQGTETLIDAYCGIGTFTLPIAKRVKLAVGLEVHAPSILQARINAQLNQISNVEFQVGAVEKLLPQLDFKPDCVLLDPPRQGCDRAVLDALIALEPTQIVYISCKPATLARDLKILCDRGNYQIDLVVPADFFPQTSHVESAVFLSKGAS